MRALRTLRGRILTLAVALAVVPLLLGLVGLVFALRFVRDDVGARNLQLAEAVAGEVGRFLGAQADHLEAIGRAGSGAGEAAGRAFAEHAGANLLVNPALRALAVLDERGQVLRAAPPGAIAPGADLSGQPWVRLARARGAPTWSAAVPGGQPGLPQVALVVPGRGGAVVGFYDLAWLAEVVGRKGEGDREGETLVADEEGTVLGARDPALALARVDVSGIGPVRAARAGQPGTGEVTFQGRRLLGSAARVPGAGWTVLVLDPPERAYGGAYRTWGSMSLALALALLAATWTGLRVVRRLLQPIDALAKATRRLASGEAPSGSLGELHRGVREIEDLADNFDAMAEAVRHREEALERSERSYRRLVSTPLAGVVRTTLAGEVLFCNEAFARLVGCATAAEVLTRPAASFYLDPAERAHMLRLVSEKGRAANLEVTLRTQDGQERPALFNVVRDEDDTLTTVVLDMTEARRAADERERLELQLLHSQKVEAIGRFAGGIAHDFNNLLTAIVAWTELLAEELPPGGREPLDGINDAVARAARLTRSLLAFSRKQVLQRTGCDLRDVVRRVETLLRSLIGEDIRFEVSLPDEPLMAQVDAGQIEQVLVNLCTNARDAMPRGGVLTLTAQAAVVGDEVAAAHGLARGGPFVRLTVRDTGEGMPPEVRARIFEPFFTTKETGKGTGLGLAIVHGIVRQHYGAVEVESVPGEGSAFHVLLPADTAAELAEAPLPPRQHGPGGHETILLAEDEPLLRAALRTVLARAGYEVIEAADGREAVERFAEHRARIALCILDVMMPAMNGRAALEAIRALEPGARAILASGYASDVLGNKGISTLGVEFVPKPVQPWELLRTIRAILDAKPKR